jgi:hypothetical protein
VHPAAVARAAMANARWCHAVCAGHQIVGHFAPDAWTCATRTPALHPDAVTLAQGADVDELLARIDPSAGCTVKDSFAELDLRPRGFEVLFEAEWIERHPQAGGPSTTTTTWRMVRDDELATWLRTWASDDVPTDVLTPDLLTEPVVVLGRFADDRVVAGAILDPADGVVGLGNVFGPDGELHRTWRECAATIDALHPVGPVVGYESGASLEAACRAGFRPVGALRVWSR